MRTPEGGSGDEFPPVGRREFFGLFAWRALQTAAGLVLVGEVATRPAHATPGCVDTNTCTGESGKMSNACNVSAGNRCTKAGAVNTCNGQATGATANSCVSPPGANTCSSAGASVNTCKGSVGGSINECSGTAANYCLGKGANTCVQTAAGSANVCTSPSANVCGTAAANVCSGDYETNTCTPTPASDTTQGRV
jgi:hypothetical protein